MSESLEEAKKKITSERVRTNILRDAEQNTIAYLVQKVPSWISSDGLTFIGLLGNILVGLSFVLAAYFHPYYLLLTIPGFIINWVGDSLDGRIAYFRKIPRKWYGFTLDITVDWIGTIFIGLGFMIYIPYPYTILGFGFVVLYGWAMISAVLRFKITGKHSIDSGLLGPTEVRVILAMIFILEVIVPGSIVYMGILAVLVLLIVNILDFKNLLKSADQRDIQEKK